MSQNSPLPESVVLGVEGLSIPDGRSSVEDDGIIIDININRSDLAQLQALIPAEKLERFS